MPKHTDHIHQSFVARWSNSCEPGAVRDHYRVSLSRRRDLPPGTSPLSKLDLGPFEVHSMV